MVGPVLRLHKLAERESENFSIFGEVRDCGTKKTPLFVMETALLSNTWCLGCT